MNLVIPDDILAEARNDRSRTSWKGASHLCKKDQVVLTIEIGRAVSIWGAFSNFHCAPEILNVTNLFYSRFTAPEPIEHKPSEKKYRS